MVVEKALARFHRELRGRAVKFTSKNVLMQDALFDGWCACCDKDVIRVMLCFVFPSKACFCYAVYVMVISSRTRLGLRLGLGSNYA